MSAQIIELWSITDGELTSDERSASIALDSKPGAVLLTLCRAATDSVVTMRVTADQLEAAAAVARAFETRSEA